MRRVLHVLTQRPSLTGSGITLDALVRHADRAGWEQRTVIGVPHDEPGAEVGGLPADRIHPLAFGGTGPDYPVPGMSDVMPYRSTRFSEMTPSQLHDYRTAWSGHLASVLEAFDPHVVHTHHVWIVSSMIKDLAPATPVVTQCHATGLRQAVLCPHLAPGVRAGCARNDRFLVLHRGHAGDLTDALQVRPQHVHVVGAGYRDDLFHARGRCISDGPRLCYVGKYSAAKGLPSLLDALERLLPRHPRIELHVAGSGAGAESDALLARMESMDEHVVLHGQLAQGELAKLLRTCAVCVLPSFYEGVPLVLVEALACGCRLVATDLPGVQEQLATPLAPALELVRLPPMVGVDRPAAEGLPEFASRLAEAIEAALGKPELGDPLASLPGALEPFSWAAVFGRVERTWKELADDRPAPR